MSKRVILLAFVMIIAVMFSAVYAQAERTSNATTPRQSVGTVTEEAPNRSVEAEEAKTGNDRVAPSGRVRNIQRVGDAAIPADQKTEKVTPVKEAVVAPAVSVTKDPNDKRAQLNGYWQMENTNWGLWINYEFTGDDAEMTFDYSGPMGFWDGSYRVISYDGNTVKLENKEEADEPIFTFNVKLNNNKLVVSNLGNSLHTTHLRHHNGTYSIVEE